MTGPPQLPPIPSMEHTFPETPRAAKPTEFGVTPPSSPVVAVDSPAGSSPAPKPAQKALKKVRSDSQVSTSSRSPSAIRTPTRRKKLEQLDPYLDLAHNIPPHSPLRNPLSNSWTPRQPPVETSSRRADAPPRLPLLAARDVQTGADDLFALMVSGSPSRPHFAPLRTMHPMGRSAVENTLHEVKAGKCGCSAGIRAVCVRLLIGSSDADAEAAARKQAATLRAIAEEEWDGICREHLLVLWKDVVLGPTSKP